MANSINGLIRLSEVLKLVPVSKSTWWKMVSEGKAPQPVKPSERCTAWKASDIQDFIDNLGGDINEKV